MAFTGKILTILAAAGLLVLAGCGNEETAEAPIDSDASDLPGTPAPSSPATPDPAMLPSALRGTSWQLMSFQSMDDAQGTMTPDIPSDYILTLGEDGSVAMKLNCNRASGRWDAEAASASSGSFEFSPLAMTRALCAEPSLDEKIARDSEYVRSYFLQDGMLHLSLMADGGIYSWAPEVTGDMGAENADTATFGETFTGSVTGSDTIEHTVEATAGQTLTVTLDASASMFFNILPPSAGAEFFPAIWVGRNEIEPDTFSAAVEETGSYRILLYQLGNAKDAGETHEYTLTVAVE